MAATTFADLAEMYVQGEKAVHPINAPTPEQLESMLALLATQFIPDGWSLGTDDLQGTIRKTVAEYRVTYDGWFPAPVAPPVNKKPYSYAYIDGKSFMPTPESLVGKSVGDSISFEGVNYTLTNYPSGILGNALPRWVIA